MNHHHHHISSSLSFLLLLVSICVTAAAAGGGGLDMGDVSKEALLVRKEKREGIAETEFGRISAVDINIDGVRGKYQLQFITLEPNSLFLPVLLHADMVFYVQSGSGSLSWVDEDGKKNQINVKRGDIYRIEYGSVFFAKSSLESERKKLRICAIFTNANNLESSQLYSKPYSSLSDLITGFDGKVLEAAFQVPEGVIERITRTEKPPPIVHAPSTNKTDEPNWSERIFQVLVRGAPYKVPNKKKTKTFNIIETKPDFQNCNGWSKTVNRKDLSALKGTNIGAFMVNLTQGSMMGPHWNPRASEIAIVLHGQGMVRVVCPRIANNSECKNVRFRVKEGDVFAVPRFHPMAHMAYNNDTLVFVGFSTMARENYPQFLAGKSSVLQTLDKDILALSFNVPNVTSIEELLSSQTESIILSCVSCAEEEEMRMQEEIEREREEAARRREEEARREEEEARKKEEEEARKREEEEARKREEEAREREETRKREEDRKREEEAREREEARKREEEEARKREEEARWEEEEARKSEEERTERREEEARERQREKEARRQQEEEARRQEEEKARRQQQEEEEARRQQKEEEARRQQEEEARRQQEEARRREEEEEKARRQEEEEARRQQEEEEEARRQQQQEEARRQEEGEEARRQEEEASRQEEEEEARRQQEEARRQQEEEARRQEEEARRQQEEEARRQEEEEEEAWGHEEGREESRREEDEARRQEEERGRGREGWREGEGSRPRKVFFF